MLAQQVMSKRTRKQPGDNNRPVPGSTRSVLLLFLEVNDLIGEASKHFCR